MVLLEFFSRGGQLFYRTSPDAPDQRFILKGTNWFGLETGDLCLHGLWSVSMNSILDFIVSNKFNALRVPFSAELALELDSKVPGNCNYDANPDMKGLTSAQMMDCLIQKCAARGILVLLDMHHLLAANGITELWHDDAAQFTEDKVIEAWKTIALRYKDSWNVFAAELKNEPHGAAAWGNDCMDTDWRLAAERIGKAVQEVNPRLLILVEGVERNVCDCPGDCSWWGGHLGGAVTHPVRLDIADKLVYSPHTYGPSVSMQSYFSDPTFPNNLPPIWQHHFGVVKEKQLGPAVVHTEWGGRFEGPDRAWQQAFAAWLVAGDMADTFYWCINPNSADTGGLLMDDWATPHAGKLELLDAVQPQPTLFDGQGNVMDPGTAPTLGPYLQPHLPNQGAAAPPPAAAAPAAVEHTAAAVQSINLNDSAPQPPAAAPLPPAAAAAKADLPPPQEATSGALSLKVTAQDGWAEGQQGQCVKYAALVTNTGADPVAAVTLEVSGFASLQQQWCCTLLSSEGGRATLGLPEWLAAGGLGGGQSFEAGVIAVLAPGVLPSFSIAGQ